MKTAICRSPKLFAIIIRGPGKSFSLVHYLCRTSTRDGTAPPQLKSHHHQQQPKWSMHCRTRAFCIHFNDNVSIWIRYQLKIYVIFSPTHRLPSIWDEYNLACVHHGRCEYKIQRAGSCCTVRKNICPPNARRGGILKRENSQGMGLLTKFDFVSGGCKLALLFYALARITT